MRFLIAGLGSAGRRHLRNLVALGEHDIVLLRSGRSTLPDADVAGFPVERDVAAALARAPDAVVVATPTALHLDVAVPAARAGCHLLLEKPVSHDLAGIDELRTAVNDRSSRVLVGFQFRFHPLLERLRSLVAAGRIGRPLWARAHWGDYLPAWHPWEDYRLAYSARAELGGGALLTLCHPIDYLTWVFGPLTLAGASVRSLGGLAIDVDDFVDVWLDGPSGLAAGVHLNYYESPAQHWLAVGGDAGSLRLDFEAGTLRGRVGAEAVREATPAGVDRNAVFLEEMKHFIDVCYGRAAPRCSLDEGCESLAIIDAARSDALGRPGH